MITRKDSRYIECPECKRKRYCNTIPLPGYYRQVTCSKGHVWSYQLTTLGKALELQKELILPKLKDLFERDDIFYRRLK